jgi:hypothetical protein
MRRSPIVVLAILAAALACGKRGDPRPPLPQGPAAVTDLAAEQEGAEILLTFTLPDRLASGEPLTDLGAIEVWRLVDASTADATPPAPPQGGEGVGDRMPGYVARRAATDLRQFQQRFYDRAKLAGRLEGEALQTATRGSSVVFRDPLAGLVTPGAEPPRIAAAVVGVRSGGERSPLSNIVVIATEIPPDAPGAVTARAEEGKVTLEWTPPARDLLGAEAKIGGYFVYRRVLPEPLPSAPLNTEPLAEPRYVDVKPPFGELGYLVRAILPEKPKVEGPSTPETTVTYRDVWAPPAPARLDALPERGGVRLVWDPSAAEDLAGYVVERAPEGGAFSRLTAAPLTEPLYIDQTAAPAVRYRYVVRAVDKAGNLGSASPEASAQLGSP